MFRFQLGIVGTVGGYLSSGFTRTANLWGYRPDQFAASASIEAGYWLAPFFMLGARGGLGFMETSRQSTNLPDRSRVAFGMEDVSATVRFAIPFAERPREWDRWRDAILSLGVQVEGGALFAQGGTHGGVQSSGAIPRVGGQLILTAHWRNIGVSGRLGFAHALWRDAGGPGVDLAFTSLYAGVGLELGQ